MLKNWKTKYNKYSTTATNYMIEKIFEYLTSVTRPAIASVSSASIGTILTISDEKPFIECLLQYGAWMIAILAGIVAIVNGIDNFITKHKNKE